MLKNNFLKEKLESGKIVIGTWLIMPSIVSADIVASCGLDFVVIDSEHGPANFETAQNMIIACESRGVSPCLRVGGICEADILKSLDIGSHCIHIPNINSRQDAEECIKFVKYPPLGIRGFSPFNRAGNYFSGYSRELTSIANKSVMLAVHIEGKEAIQNIDNILKIKGIDIIFIGLFDISKSLGIPGRVEDKRVTEILVNLTKKVNKAGKYPGSIVTNSKQLEIFIHYGVRYITYSADCEVLSNGYRRIVDDFKDISKQ